MPPERPPFPPPPQGHRPLQVSTAPSRERGLLGHVLKRKAAGQGSRGRESLTPEGRQRAEVQPQRLGSGEVGAGRARTLGHSRGPLDWTALSVPRAPQWRTQTGPAYCSVVSAVLSGEGLHVYVLTRVLLPLTYTVEGGVIGDLPPFSSWGRDGKRVHRPLETSQTSGRQAEVSAPGRGSGPAGMGHRE